MHPLSEQRTQTDATGLETLLVHASRGRRCLGRRFRRSAGTSVAVKQIAKRHISAELRVIQIVTGYVRAIEAEPRVYATRIRGLSFYHNALILR